MEEWVTIRCLHKKGKSKRAIARELNLSRNTVKKAIKQEKPPKYKLKKKRKSMLEEYRDEIEKMYFKDNFIGSRILDEIRKTGYKGGTTTFYDFLSKLKETKNISKISKPYETAPGKQCQFDWAHYTVNIAGKQVKIYVFCVILGYSRKKKYTASMTMDQSSVFEAIEEAFKYFGGVPEEILTDNAKQMVDNANPKDFKWNDKFYSLCGVYSISPKACKVRTPKTKGKVERPFHYLENHFIKGSNFASFKEVVESLADFTEKVNNNKHSIINTSPNERFKDEFSLLNPLPKDYFHGILEEIRKVNWDLLLSYKGNRYSVPYYYAGKYVWVKRVSGIYLHIYSNDGRLIAKHEIAASKGAVIKDDKHYNTVSKDVPKTLAVLKTDFMKHFPENSDFLDRLLTKNHSTATRRLRFVLSLRKYYSDTDISQALTKSVLWNSYSREIITSVLRTKADIKQTEYISRYHSENINKKINSDESNIVRDLNYYENLF